MKKNKIFFASFAFVFLVICCKKEEDNPTIKYKKGTERKMIQVSVDKVSYYVIIIGETESEIRLNNETKNKKVKHFPLFVIKSSVEESYKISLNDDDSINIDGDSYFSKSDQECVYFVDESGVSIMKKSFPVRELWKSRDDDCEAMIELKKRITLHQKDK